MKSIYHIISFFLVLLIFVGCSEDWLELTNPNQQTTETFWQTEEDIQKGVNATYMGLLYDGTWMRFAPFALNLKADDARSESPWKVLSLTGKFNLDYGDPIMAQWPWTSLYGVVNRANQVLYNIDNVEFSSVEFKNQCQGEALFLRAFSYYYLVSFYRNIPLVLEPYLGTTEELYPTQASPEIVWSQIMEDFHSASELLPATYPDEEKGRATKGAALAFLGKSYLMNKDYTNASAYFEQVIDMENDGIYGLMENYEDNFTTEHENNIESVFEIQLDRSVGGTTLGWVSAPEADWSKTSAHAITFAPTPYGFGDVDATTWIFEEFFIEPNIDGNVDERILTCISYDTSACEMYGLPFREAFDSTRWNGIFVRKYTNAYSERADELDWRSDINERVMRFAEVLMMYAECQYELGNTGVAGDYMQRVRDRVGLPDISDDIAAMDKDNFYSQLSHDKALEFAFEGIRFEDIVRWGWLYDATRLEELKSHDAEYSGYIKGREYFPIPPAELDKNPNYEKNPGW